MLIEHGCLPQPTLTFCVTFLGSTHLLFKGSNCSSGAFRFVRFVSTPEVLERAGTVAMELIEIEETIRAQTTDALEEHQTVKLINNYSMPRELSPLHQFTNTVLRSCHHTTF